MDLDDGSSNISGDEEAVVAETFAAASAILNVVAEEEGRRCTKLQKVKHGGSRPGKAPNLNRDFAGAYKTVVHQYFSGADSLYNEESFERRFGCPRVVVDRLWTAIEGCEPFVTKTNSATRLPGIRPLVRFTAAMRMLVYGDCADRMDEGLQLSESVTSDALKHFCRLVVEKFDGYLNKCAKKEQIIQLMSKRGFPGCFGSWD